MLFGEICDFYSAMDARGEGVGGGGKLLGGYLVSRCFLLVVCLIKTWLKWRIIG